MPLPVFNESTMRYHDPETNKMMSREKAEAALGIAQQQQEIVGGALVGGTGAVGADGTLAQEVPILEQILAIQNSMLTAIKDVAQNLIDMLSFDEDEARRRKERLTEKNKEIGPGGEVGSEGVDDAVDDGGGGRKKGWLGALLGGAVLLKLRKLLAPILLFFGPKGMLFKLFGRFGPLGLLIVGFTLFYKYAEEISEALQPAIDKIADIVEKLQPLIDLVMDIGDFLIKDFIKTVGEAFDYLFGGIETFIDGVKLLFDGDWKAGLTLMFQGLLDFLMAIPTAVFNSLVRIFDAVWEKVGPSFIKMVEGVKQLAVDALLAVTEWFQELKDKIVGFFKDGYEKTKAIMSNAVQSSFDFMANIFNSIGTFFSDSYDKVKTWITGLPDRVLGMVKEMFQPVLDFFAMITNKMKGIINGIVDALPLPGWLKDKIKFDIEPTDAQLQAEVDKEVEKFKEKKAAQVDELPQVSLSDQLGSMKIKDGILQDETGSGPAVFESESRAKTYARSIMMKDHEGTGPELEVIGKDNKFYVIVKDLNTSLNPKVLNLNDAGASAVPAVNAADLEDIDSAKAGVNTVIHQTYSVKKAVAAKSDVHSGPLDVIVDPYHDKHSYSGYNWPAMGGASSDIRLKEDIKLEGKSPSNINIYSFKYKGQEGKYKGVMAQEVPWASFEDDNGYLMVDYSKLDVDFVKI